MLRSVLMSVIYSVTLFMHDYLFALVDFQNCRWHIGYYGYFDKALTPFNLFTKRSCLQTTSTFSSEYDLFSLTHCVLNKLKENENVGLKWLNWYRTNPGLICEQKTSTSRMNWGNRRWNISKSTKFCQLQQNTGDTRGNNPHSPRSRVAYTLCLSLPSSLCFAA